MRQLREALAVLAHVQHVRQHIHLLQPMWLAHPQVAVSLYGVVVSYTATPALVASESGQGRVRSAQRTLCAVKAKGAQARDKWGPREAL
jgi:hypothetical protein